MEVIPAIDLLEGRVVRLEKGDFTRVTIYSDDPVSVARRWVEQGAERLHVVDLDGARVGHPVQRELVSRIIAGVDVPCQVAGGLRDEVAVERALADGADRVVLGTALLDDPTLGRQLVTVHGSERVVAAIDVRSGSALGGGWLSGGAAVPALDAMQRLQAEGVTWFAVTAIERDGLLEGPDLELLEQVAGNVSADRVIASAGVATARHVQELAKHGFAAAILGRALYEGTVSLPEALAAARGAGSSDIRSPGEH